MIAKGATLLYGVIAAVLLIRYLGFYNPNLVVSAIIWAGLLAVALHLLRVRPTAACWAGAGALVLAFMVTCMIAGDWEPAQQIATTCIVTPIGTLHNHHGPKGGLVTIIHFVLFLIIKRTSDEMRPAAVMLFGRRLGRCAFWLFITAIAMSPFIIRDGHPYGVTFSMFIDTFCYSLYLGLLALVCREGNTQSPWFTTFFAISSGMALSVLVSGGMEFQKDIVAGGKVPSTFILWHSEGDPSCFGK